MLPGGGATLSKDVDKSKIVIPSLSPLRCPLGVLRTRAPRIQGAPRTPPARRSHAHTATRSRRPPPPAQRSAAPPLLHPAPASSQAAHSSVCALRRTIPPAAAHHENRTRSPVASAFPCALARTLPRRPRRGPGSRCATHSELRHALHTARTTLTNVRSPRHPPHARACPPGAKHAYARSTRAPTLPLHRRNALPCSDSPTRRPLRVAQNSSGTGC